MEEGKKMNDNVKPPEDRWMKIFNSYKADLSDEITKIETYIRDFEDQITEKHKEIDLLDALTATLKEHIVEDPKEAKIAEGR